MPDGNVPVLMYHSVGKVLPDWEWSYLTVPPAVFEDHLRWLAREGFRTAGLEELHAHVEGRKLLPPRTVVLTFDDGYLDNWTYAAPLLERYGFTAIVFVNPEFVDPRETVRPTLKDVASGKVREEDLEVRGFMSWEELKLLDRNGPISIGSHLMTHTWYPVGPAVVDFHRPGDGCYWLDWNRFPAEKPFYLRDPRGSRVPWGTPIHENRKSMAATRYENDPAEEEALVARVRDGGGEAFFREEGWREALHRTLAEVRSRRGAPGRTETGEERRARLSWEIVRSREEIGRRLGHPVEFMAWPGGAYDEEGIGLALGAYKAVTLSSSQRRAAGNKPGEDPRRISRLGIPCVGEGSRIRYFGGRYLTLFLLEQEGSRRARRLRQILKLFGTVRALPDRLSRRSSKP